VPYLEDIHIFILGMLAGVVLSVVVLLTTEAWPRRKK
jgi:hypothetical protein